MRIARGTGIVSANRRFAAYVQRRPDVPLPTFVGQRMSCSHHNMAGGPRQGQCDSEGSAGRGRRQAHLQAKRSSPLPNPSTGSGQALPPRGEGTKLTNSLNDTSRVLGAKRCLGGAFQSPCSPPCQGGQRWAAALQAVRRRPCHSRGTAGPSGHVLDSGRTEIHLRWKSVVQQALMGKGQPRGKLRPWPPAPHATIARPLSPTG